MDETQSVRLFVQQVHANQLDLAVQHSTARWLHYVEVSEKLTQPLYQRYVHERAKGKHLDDHHVWLQAEEGEALSEGQP